MEVKSFQIDKSLARKAFGKAAQHYEQAAALQHEIERRLLERLDLVRLQPARVLDLGCGTGRGSHALLARYPKAELVSLDTAFEMISRLMPLYLTGSSSTLSRFVGRDGVWHELLCNFRRDFWMNR